MSWADETIVVEDHPSPEAARADLEAELRDEDYLRVVHLGDKTIWLNKHRWKGRVVVWDDGRIDVHVPVFTPLLVAPARGGAGATWSMGSGREANQIEAERLGDLAPLAARWQDAIANQALAVRLEEVGQQLDAIWRGTAIDGTELPDIGARRSAIIALWLHTADNDAGYRVRRRVLAFVRGIVQPEAPFTTDEIADADRRRGFPDRFTVTPELVP